MFETSILTMHIFNDISLFRSVKQTWIWVVFWDQILKVLSTSCCCIWNPPTIKFSLDYVFWQIRTILALELKILQTLSKWWEVPICCLFNKYVYYLIWTILFYPTYFLILFRPSFFTHDFLESWHFSTRSFWTTRMWRRNIWLLVHWWSLWRWWDLNILLLFELKLWLYSDWLFNLKRLISMIYVARPGSVLYAASMFHLYAPCSDTLWSLWSRYLTIQWKK